jgi:sec-independent protein translocase protein TatA
MGLDNPIHLAILLMILLLVFGAKRLPEMGRGLGDGMRGFRDAMSGNSPAADLNVAASSETPAKAEILTQAETLTGSSESIESATATPTAA